ncbi:MAG: DNA polymerase III subunit delta' [Epsilonproteobacteria bacterium]|nr:DNA polymerase III subunit delta' [Campylobacterota bacterium]
MFPHRGYILICDDIEEQAQILKEEVAPKRCVLFVKEKFLVEDAKAVTAEAYISESDFKYIIIGAKEFNVYSQNALLKILEEPPKNIVFIILSPSKSALLPTVRSRLPIQKVVQQHESSSLELDLKRLDLTAIFDFLQEHKNISKNDAKVLVEALYKKALLQGISMNENQLENFDKAYRLLELNTRPSYILTLLLMGFLHENQTTFS